VVDDQAKFRMALSTAQPTIAPYGSSSNYRPNGSNKRVIIMPENTNADLLPQVRVPRHDR
jgi:hypothetical protein